LILVDHGMISNEGDFNYHSLLQKKFFSMVNRHTWNRL